VSWIDLVIAAVLVLAGLRGYFAGAVLQVIGLAGFFGGFIVGTLVAPSISSRVASATGRAVLTLIIILVATLLGNIAGSFVGRFARRFLHTVKLGLIDSLVGVAVGVAGALIACWLVAGLLASSGWAPLASGIQQSSILSAMDKVMPPVPSIDTKVQSLLRGTNLPNIFAAVVAPSLKQYENPDRLGPLVTSLGSPSDVVKVLASGTCPNESEGTAFYVTSDEVVTNAHVVAGHTTITVDGVSAQVALYDPLHDLAVLRVPQRPETPLRFLRQLPARGTRIEVIGFPLNASRTGAPGYVEGELTAQGRDIYNQALVKRTVLALEVNVQPGNSGSPVLAGPFVAGILEAKSLSQTSTAYAILDRVIESDLAKTPATGSVSTQGCLP
jgi:S1-C subfamily serine protease